MNTYGPENARGQNWTRFRRMVAWVAFFGITAHAEAGPQAPSSDPTSRFDFVRVADTGLLLKVVGLTDSVRIVEAPNSPKTVATMEPLKPYFVLEDLGDHYRISSLQGEGGAQGFVASREVAIWNTREALHFEGATFAQDRRASVAAWESLDRIRKYARTGDLDAYGPTFKEESQTRVGTRGIIPYPLLKSDSIDLLGGGKRRIYQVLLPVIVPDTVETDLSPQEVRSVAGAVTICVVFDATASMRKYARDFAKTVDSILTELRFDTDLAAAGFVLFRDLGAPSQIVGGLRKSRALQRFEIAQPMPLADASAFLRRRTSQMVGGDDPAEPVLDAVMLAQNSFLWNGGTAIRGAQRIVILVGNTDAKPETVALSNQVPAGLGAEDVARRLSQSGISVFALQAGRVDHGHLVRVLSTLATETGGEFYRAAADSAEVSKRFSMDLKGLLHNRIVKGAATAERLSSQISVRARGGTLIPLNVLDEDVRKRLGAAAQAFYLDTAGLVMTKAWVFEEPDLYQEKILIEKELLEWLVRFLNVLTDSALDGSALYESVANLLAVMTGEDPDTAAEIQDLFEKIYGIHFTTNLLSFDLERLAALSAQERALLQDSLREATGALADFLDRNAKRFNEQPRVWMPVSLLP